MASGWNLWVWLPCIGAVSGCCCKEVYKDRKNILKMNKVGMLLPKKELIQVE